MNSIFISRFVGRSFGGGTKVQDDAWGTRKYSVARHRMTLRLCSSRRMSKCLLNYKWNVRDGREEEEEEETIKWDETFILVFSSFLLFIGAASFCR